VNILLVGEESAGIHALRRLGESGHRVVGVMASPKPKYGSPVTLWITAKKLGYRTWPAESVRDPLFAQQVRVDEVDVLLNIHSLYVINAEVLRAPKIGSFNLHPGPLPRYAGLNPVSWALYFGEKSHGVTLHWMTPEIDAGPIVYQSCFPVTDADTGFSLSLRCIKKGLPMISQLLEALDDSPASLPQTPQDVEQRQCFDRRVPQRGRVIWTLPALRVLNFVRACDFCPFLSPWGHPQTRKDNLEIQIVKARLSGIRADTPPGTVGYLDAGSPVVACADEWIYVDKVKVRDRFLDAAEVLVDSDRLEDGG
jgi:methionyl-tRNA formyltransferase